LTVTRKLSTRDAVASAEFRKCAFPGDESRTLRTVDVLEA
jgi:hypothetical protein